MTGLDKIINGIKEESDKKAKETLNRAEQEAKQIVEDARKKAEAECAAISAKAEQERKNILEWSKSAAELKRRQILLAEKQKFIREVIAEAEKKLSTLSEEEYFSIFYKMTARFSLPKDGKMILSKRDKDRLPNNFESKIKEALDEKGTLVISEEIRNIDGGFILSYDGVEENCSFKALFESSYEILQDKVHEILFA